MYGSRQMPENLTECSMSSLATDQHSTVIGQRADGC
jgi:hypothetical protein